MALSNLDGQIHQLVEQTNAMQMGHFQLASGLHSSRFFRCIKLLENPQSAEFLFIELAQRFSKFGKLDYVLGANEAGSILAFELAKRLNTKVAIARQSQHQYALIDGFEFAADQRILIVDDITTTGGTAKQLIQIVRSAAAVPVGVGLIATKGLFEVDLSCPTEVLITLEGMDAVSPENCPLCQQGVPLSK